jgi:hypothetical protein
MAKYREVMMKERTVADDELRSLTQRGEPLRLKGENLQGAHLEEANLRRASVGMADLRWARLGEARRTFRTRTWSPRRSRARSCGRPASTVPA